MDKDFWHNCWQKDHIAFHQDQVNPLLIEHWLTWAQGNQARVFVPLCGKSQDMLYLAQYQPVLGSELSAIACDDFYQENQLPVVKQYSAELVYYQHQQIALYQGDIFALTPKQVADCQLIYDRAALVALPESLRAAYVLHLRQIFGAGTRMFLLTLEYPPDEIQGPPFRVSQAEVQRLFAGCTIEKIATLTLADHRFARRTLAVSSLTEVVYSIVF